MLEGSKLQTSELNKKTTKIGSIRGTANEDAAKATYPQATHMYVLQKRALVGLRFFFFFFTSIRFPFPRPYGSASALSAALLAGQVQAIVEVFVSPSFFFSPKFETVIMFFEGQECSPKRVGQSGGH